MTFLPSVIPPLRRKPHVTEDEAKLIWAAAKKDHVYLLIKTLWFTGLRISEALALTGDSLVNGGPSSYTLIVHSLKKHRGKKEDTVKPDRLPVQSDFGEELRRYIANNKIRPRQRIFPSVRSTYWRQIQKCARDAGVENWRSVHPHSFRHGFVYYKATQGVHPYILSRLARHEDIRTTLGYYEPSDEDLRKAMEL